jgi:hypothetical protein
MSSSDSQSGTSLRDFVKKLNTDDEFREKFLKDPVGQLQGLGWAVPDNQKQELINIASEIASEITTSAEYKYRIDITDTTLTVRLGLRI